jgi:hypothetical protein
VDSYYLVAVLLVLAIPVGLLVLGYGLVQWGRDSLHRAPLVGGVGVLAATLAIVNLVVARSCGTGTNRPIVSAVLSSDACHRDGVLALALPILLVVGTAALVRLRDARTSVRR